MTNEELVKLYQNGDKSALDKLIERNKGIIYKLVNKYYICKTNLIDKEDLMQEGYIGLIKAAQKYDLNNEKRAQFITYAVYWINEKISRNIIQEGSSEETSLNIHTKEDSEAELQDFIKDKENSFENIEDQLYNKELRAELEEVMNRVNTLKEREILKFRYGWDNGRDMSQIEVGDIYGISRQAIQQIESKAFMKMRNTTWGRLKAKELFHYKELRNGWSIPGTIERINFAGKYLLDEVV